MNINKKKLVVIDATICYITGGKSNKIEIYQFLSGWCASVYKYKIHFFPNFIMKNYDAPDEWKSAKYIKWSRHISQIFNAIYFIDKNICWRAKCV